MAISVLQTQSASGSSPLTVTLTSTTGGSTLIAAVGGSTGTFASSIVAGGSSNLAAAKQEADAALASAEVWYLDLITSGMTSIVVTNPGTPGHYGMVVYEVADIGAVGGSFDTASGATLDTTTPVPWSSGASGTLSQANEILIGCTGMGGISSAITGPASPWTNTTPVAYMIAGQKIVSATTSQTYAGSANVSGTGRSASIITSFKMGSASPAFIADPNPIARNQAVMRAAVW